MIITKKINFKRISEKDENDWNYILDHSDDATIFHTPEWVGLMVEEVDLVCEVLLAYNNGKPIGVFPYYVKKSKFFFKKYTTSAFETPYGSPIIIINSQKDIILDTIIKNQIKSFFIRNSRIILPPNYNSDIFINNGYKSKAKETLLIHLDLTENDLWYNIQSSRRRSIRKAVKNNVKLIDGGIKYIPELHLLLEKTYKKLGLSSPKNIRFYNKLFRLLQPLGRVKLFVVFYDEKPIGAIIFLKYKNKITAWQGGSDEKYLKHAPNNMLYWNIIKYGKDKGFKLINFLHHYDENGDEIISLKNYKMSFGAIPKSYYILSKDVGLYVKLKSLII